MTKLESGNKIRIRTGFGRETASDLVDFIRLAHQIFADEQGYTVNLDPRGPCLDWVITVAHRGDLPVGMAYGELTGAKFPRASLFQKHLDRPALRDLENSIGYMGYIGVIPELRGEKITFQEGGNPVGLAQQIVIDGIVALRKQGARIIVINANHKAVPFYRRLGFRAVDGVTNVGPKNDLVPMVLIPNEVDHLRNIQSPLLGALGAAQPLSVEEKQAVEYVKKVECDIPPIQ